MSKELFRIRIPIVIIKLFSRISSSIILSLRIKSNAI